MRGEARMTTESGKRVVIFIESNTTGTGRLFVRAARKVGFKAVLFAANPKLYPFAEEEAVPIIEIDTQDEQKIIAACAAIAGENVISGIVSTSDHYLVLAARLARRFGLPGPSVEAVMACRIKTLQYRALSDAGVPIPASVAAETVRDAVTAARTIRLPVVLKPEQGTGSVGVKLCQSVPQVAAHAHFLLAQHTNERGLPVPPAIIVQEFVEGPEYSIEAIGTKVIGITRKHLGSQPHFVETGHDYPAILPDKAAAAMVNATTMALGALDLRWGAAHVELRWASDGPRIIEVNPRLAGGFIPELIRVASGIDIITELMRCVIGQEPRTQPTAMQFAAIRFIIPRRSGRLESVTGVEEAAQSETVIAAEVYRPTGSEIRLHGDFRDRIGHIMGCGKDPGVVAQRVEIALSTIKVEIQ